jgi:hypothetical protein
MGRPARTGRARRPACDKKQSANRERSGAVSEFMKAADVMTCLPVERRVRIK